MTNLDIWKNHNREDSKIKIDMNNKKDIEEKMKDKSIVDGQNEQFDQAFKNYNKNVDKDKNLEILKEQYIGSSMINLQEKINKLIQEKSPHLMSELTLPSGIFNDINSGEELQKKINGYVDGINFDKLQMHNAEATELLGRRAG